MKKSLLLVVLLVLLMPIMVNAETCEGVYIDSVTEYGRANNAEEEDEVLHECQKLDLNLSMSKVGDFVEYDVVVKNDTDEDVEISEDSLNASSDYFDYTASTEDGDFVIDAKSTKNIRLKVEYKANIPDEKFVGGEYNDNGAIDLNITGGGEDIEEEMNPQTSDKIIVYLGILAVSVVGLSLLTKKKRYYLGVFAIVAMVALIPKGINAVSTYEIKVGAKVTVDKCKTWLITNEGSFSPDSNVTKVCFDGYYDYKYTQEWTTVLWGQPQGDQIKYKVLNLDNMDGLFTENSWFKVYKDEAKTDLMYTITMDDFAKPYFNVRYNYFMGPRTTIHRFLGEAEEYYFDMSEDLANSNFRYYIMYSNQPKLTKTEYIGPWLVTDSEINSLNYLNESLAEGRVIKEFTNCHIYDKGQENRCYGNKYYANIVEQSTIEK